MVFDFSIWNFAYKRNSMNNSDTTKRPTTKLMKGILSVKEKQVLSPHYTRVILEGDDISNFEWAQVGDNNKIIVPKDKNTPIHLPEKGLGAAGEEKPVVRTYTLRDLDLNEGEMVVDFVTHGKNGLASKWAIEAEKGDQLGVLMKEKGKVLFESADFYVFVGDHTALPVISVMLEQLPADAMGKVIIEVYDEADVLQLQKPAGVELIWAFNDEPGKTSALPHQVAQLEFPEDKSRFVFVAAEYAASKFIVNMLRDNFNLKRNEFRSTSYWKYGQDEEDSRATRSEAAHRG